MRKTRREITIETDRLLVVSSGQRVLLWCDSCAAQVEMISVDEGALMAQVNSRKIFHWVEASRLHFSEEPMGPLLVCLRSLEQLLASGGVF
jgi:hypothetical protein